MTFDNWMLFFRKSVEKVQVSLKSDKNSGYVITWIIPPSWTFELYSFRVNIHCHGIHAIIAVLKKVAIFFLDIKKLIKRWHITFQKSFQTFSSRLWLRLPFELCSCKIFINIFGIFLIFPVHAIFRTHLTLLHLITLKYCLKISSRNNTEFHKDVRKTRN